MARGGKGQRVMQEGKKRERVTEHVDMGEIRYSPESEMPAAGVCGDVTSAGT